MAKKAPVKKSKRRLKRSVRRSLSAVLMITAIGVAAIPVPENRASAPGIATIAAKPDVHKEEMEKGKDVPKYGFEPKYQPGTLENNDEYQDDNDIENSDITLNKWIDTKTQDLKSMDDMVDELAERDDGSTNGNTIYASYTVQTNGQTADGAEDYRLSWQFLYYTIKNPNEGGGGGVVCRYNNSFLTDTVSLPLYLNTKYFVVSKTDVDNWFDPSNWGGSYSGPKILSVKMQSGVDPTQKYKYSYEDFKRGTSPEPFLQEYFGEPGGELEAKKSAFEAYQKIEGEDVDGAQKPEALVKKPTDLADGTLRLKYFAESCKTLTDAGSGFTLVGAHDGRPKKAGEMPEDIYLAKGGQAGEGAHVDEQGFLVLEQSRRNMIAIGNRAFENVANVTNMTFSEQIAYIGDEAFLNASMLQSVKLVNVSKIGNRAFRGCNNLATVDLGDATKSIGAECFSGTHLSEINFGTALKKVGYGAFADCSSLAGITFADNIRDCEVEDYAFYNCPALTSVAMENAGVTKLGNGAFATASGAQPMSFVLPKSLSNPKGIGNYLFAGRAALQSVTFPQDYGRSSDKPATIPNCVFHGCVNLQYVEFPCNEASDPYACGFVSFEPKQLFADVINPDFYVRGPKMNTDNEVAKPREATWDAETAVSTTVPYVYTEGGKDYYEVSDGFYLLCINSEGMLTSCTFKSDKEEDWNRWLKDPIIDEATGNNSGGESGRLVIPSVVGKTKVVGIAPGCFSDPNLNKRVKELKISDDSITSIGDGVFQGKEGTGKWTSDKGEEETGEWQNLEKVYIGNSVTSVGANAFKDCKSLIDVTFASPSAGHEAFQIGQDAFKTQSPKLTFHGDIVEGYAPFEWATDPENVIEEEKGLRVCYQSLAPTYLTVMYNPVTDLVTLLDYPKNTKVSEILNEIHEDEIADEGYSTYEEMMTEQWYDKYVGLENDSLRKDFASSWLDAPDDAAKTALYENRNIYGPWINKDFVAFMNETDEDKIKSWIGGTEKYEDWRDADSWVSNLASPADFLFEPITAYAEEIQVKPYYETYPYNVLEIVDANDPYRAPTAEESGLVYYSENIEIPAGVESIDVYGYVNNLDRDGKPTTGLERNTENWKTYFHDSVNGGMWDPHTRHMYEGSVGEEDEDVEIKPGLFSGSYKDYDGESGSEKRVRGNDLIRTVKLGTVKYLPDYAFDSCENLYSVDIGECADIGKAPFRGCSSMVTVSNNDYYTTDNGIIYSVNEDGSLTIEECLSARGNLVGNAVVDLNNDPKMAQVSAIKQGAFEDCDSLNEVKFGQNDTAGLTAIPQDCFKNCDNLQTVVLPMMTNDIGREAFTGDDKLSYLTIYGKEVKISGRAFDEKLANDPWITVRAYEDSAVVRYVNEYGDECHLRWDETNKLGEMWQVSFYDQNYKLIEDLKDRDGNDLANPQYVEDGDRAVEPQTPANTEDWTFERWVGSNNVQFGDRITEDTSFFAQGYTNSGMVDGKYPVSFYDGIDGTQVGPTQYIAPGSSAIAPAHPVHAGYTADGYSVSYENIQAATTIIMKYKPTATSGGGTNTPGTTSGTTTSNRTTSNTSSTSNTSNSSNTSSSNSTSSTSTSSDGSSEAAGKHTVTVVNGSGSGEYATGATVWIIANKAADGQQFSKWATSTSGVTIASVSNEATSFVMPATDVTVTAEYTAAAAPASNTAGTGGNANNNNNNGSGSDRVDITKPGISNKDLATANVNGSTDNFVVKITETDEATRAVADALTNKYGSLDNILYYAMDISLYDSTGTTKISDTTGLTVDITIPIPDALVAYGGNNMAGAVVNGNQLESLNESFTAINGVPCIRFTATHFSPYTVYVDTGNLTEGMIDTTPKTGDPIHPKWFLSIGLACLSVILFMKKDKGAKVKTA